MKNMDFKIVKVRDDAVLPVYQTEHAAGMDLCACLDAPLTLKPMQRAMISTGLSIELPDGYESQIRARSGLSSKFGITLINGVGTIDADYRGEYCVVLINLGEKSFVVEPGMRIAQLVISKYEKIEWNVVESLSETERGAGGFGSTGTKS